MNPFLEEVRNASEKDRDDKNRKEGEIKVQSKQSVYDAYQNLCKYSKCFFLFYLSETVTVLLCVSCKICNFEIKNQIKVFILYLAVKLMFIIYLL